MIRRAAHAPNLAVFDDHHYRPLYLGRANRIANPDQRITLLARGGATDITKVRALWWLAVRLPPSVYPCWASSVH